MRKVSSAGSTANSKSAKLELLLVQGSLGDISSVISVDGDRFRCLESKSFVLILEKNCRCRRVLPDQLPVVVPNVASGRPSEVPLAQPGAWEREGVKTGNRGIHGREALVLMQGVAGRHDTGDHVVQALSPEDTYGRFCHRRWRTGPRTEGIHWGRK